MSAAKFARAFSLKQPNSKTSSSGRTSSELNLFSLDDNLKKLTKEETQRVHEVSLQLSRLGNNEVPATRIQHAVRSRVSNGDSKETLKVLLSYEQSTSGVLRNYDPTIKMLGAENWEKTTCWLDSILFAMFGKTDVFEACLHQQYEDEERRNMVNAMRFWVNLLRSGKLIPIEITRRLQATIAECGWAEAAKPKQQDASEAFNFITDKLQLPLLTLKTDIYHQGKEDANDDHKFITERMLDVAIPEDLEEGVTLKLESCLEDYFNNRVEVKRHLAKQNTEGSTMPSEDEKSSAAHIEVAEVDSRASTPVQSEDSIQKTTNQRPLHMRARAASIFSERKSQVSKSGDEDGKEGQSKKEVLMPAWQFLNLIPWYTDNMPEGDSQVRSHFAQKRLMLGICIKRYGVTKQGQPYRRSTHIDIPMEMASPHFTTGDEIDREGTDASKFKLVLESLVCHRGHSVEAGHYISLLRVEAPKADPHGTFVDATGEQRPVDLSHDLWLKFDDLAGDRVSTVDINKALKEESPYLLFYRVTPIDEDGPDETPPPYQESEASLDYVDQKLAHLEASSQRTSTELRGSNRPSMDLTSPDSIRERPSLSERHSSLNGPGSAHDSVIAEPASGEQVTPANSYSPAVSRQPTKKSHRDSDTKQNEEIGRRLSMTMSKLAARLSRDKLNNPDVMISEVPDEHEVRGHISTTSIEEEEEPPPPAAPVKSPPPVTIVKDGGKEKKKKFKLPGHARRGSNNDNLDKDKGNKGKGGKPDRECIIQ